MATRLAACKLYSDEGDYENLDKCKHLLKEPPLRFPTTWYRTPRGRPAFAASPLRKSPLITRLFRQQAARRAADLAAISAAHKEPSFARRPWRQLVEVEGGPQPALRALREKGRAPEPQEDWPTFDFQARVPRAEPTPKLRKRRPTPNALSLQSLYSAIMLATTLISLGSAAADTGDAVAFCIRVEYVMAVSVGLVMIALWRLLASPPNPVRHPVLGFLGGGWDDLDIGAAADFDQPHLPEGPPSSSPPSPTHTVLRLRGGGREGADADQPLPPDRPSSFASATSEDPYGAVVRIRVGGSNAGRRAMMDAAAASGLEPQSRVGGSRPDLWGIIPGSNARTLSSNVAPDAALATAVAAAVEGAPAPAAASAAVSAPKRPRTLKAGHAEEVARHVGLARNWKGRRVEDVLALKAVKPQRDAAALQAADNEYADFDERVKNSFRSHECCCSMYVAADELKTSAERDEARAAADRYFLTSANGTPQIVETSKKSSVVFQGRLSARVMAIPEFSCSSCKKTWRPNAVLCSCWPSAPCGIVPDNSPHGRTRWISLNVLDDFALYQDVGGLSAMAYAAVLEEASRVFSACAASFIKLGLRTGSSEFHTFNDKLLMNAHSSYQEAARQLDDERAMGIEFCDGVFYDCCSCSTVIDYHHAAGRVGVPIKSCDPHSTMTMDASVTMHANEGNSSAARDAEAESPTGFSTSEMYFDAETNIQVATGHFKLGEPVEEIDDHNDLHCSNPVFRAAPPGTAAVGIAGCACPHGYPVRKSFINMLTPENWSMYLGILYRTLVKNPVDAIRWIYLDFGCLFKTAFYNFFANPAVFVNNITARSITFFVDWLHAKGHRPWCRFTNSAMYVAETGRRIGAQCEELWAKVRVCTNWCALMYI